jgi:hypothetical protein
MTTFRFALCFIVAATLWVAGCATSSLDPLADWTFRPFPGWGVNPNGHNNNTLDKVITDDYQDFILKHKLSVAGAISGFFEDGTGRHAVKFDTYVPNQNATLTYALIYDKDNKRTKVIKFDYHRYQS